MGELIKKISSYNIFNFLLPGILFAVIVDSITPYSLIINNNFVGAFVYYFIGMIIGRFGSLCIEPLLKKSKILTFAEYSDYVKASKKDNKIGEFSEINNMYRNIISMLILIFLVWGFSLIPTNYNIPAWIKFSSFLLLLLVTFILSYRKQTNYITNRIKITLNEDTEKEKDEMVEPLPILVEKAEKK